MTSETFRRVDRNRDGRWFRPSSSADNDWDDDRSDFFDDLDINNNGRMERSEWHGGASVFAQLDRNRDDMLSRFEVGGGQNDDRWDPLRISITIVTAPSTAQSGTSRCGSFNQREMNGDGVLSRREYRVRRRRKRAAAPIGPRTVRVNSQQRWTDVGVEVRAGDTMTFEATGTIRMSDNTEDVAGPRDR